MIPAPIVLFVYNRPWHTKETVEALKKNELADESELFIYSDGPKDNLAQAEVENVRKYLKTIDGFKNITIIEREKNHGLAKSIIEGVTEIINKYGKIIVLEDDLVTSPYFLKYMNEALNFYEKEERVASIHGYIYPVKGDLPNTFFIKGADCWGWGTWKRGWDLFEIDGKKLLKELKDRKLTKEFDFSGSYPYVRMLECQILGLNNSWAVRWYASAFLADKLTLYPGKSLLKNIGMDDTGIHSGNTDFFNVDLICQPISIKKQEIKEDKKAKKIIAHYFDMIGYNTILSKTKFFVKKTLLCWQKSKKS